MLALLVACAAAQAADTISLFNGKDLTGWIGRVALAPAHANGHTDAEGWEVKDGAIYCTGKGGHLYTVKDDYKNYKLHVEFRWGQIDPEVLKKGGNIYNSGIFLRADPLHLPENGVMIYGYEAQIVNTPTRTSQRDGTGDVWVMGLSAPSFKGDGQEAPPIVPPPGMSPPAGYTPARMWARYKFNEKPIGEWNAYDITFDRDQVTLKLNGVVVEHATGAPDTAGRIGLECENTPIEFRNIQLTPLKR
jgi:hypothetical protein